MPPSAAAPPANTPPPATPDAASPPEGGNQPQTPPAAAPPDAVVGKRILSLLTHGRAPAEAEEAREDAATAEVGADGTPGAPAPDPKKKDKAQPAAPDAPPAPDGADPGATDAGKGKDKKTKVRRAREIDPIQIAAEAGASAGREVVKGLQKKETPTAPPAREPESGADIPPKYARKFAVIEHMAKTNPTAYGGLPNEFRRALAATEAYRVQWQKDNPGKKFVPEDEEHSPFFDANDVDYDDMDFQEALVDLRTQPSAAEKQRIKQLEAEVDRLTKSDKARGLEPAVSSAREVAASHVVTTLNPELAKAAATPETLRAAVDADPTGEAVMILEGARHAGNLVAEAVRVLDGGDVDMRNPVTAEFLRFKGDIEQHILRLPADDQYDEQDRKFLTWDQYVAAAKEDPQGAARKYWYLDKENLMVIIPGRITASVRAKIDADNQRLEKLAEKRGWKKPDATPKGGKQDATKKKDADTATAVPSNGSPPNGSPSAPAGRTAVSPVNTPGSKNTEDWQDNFMQAFSGR